MYFSFIAFTDKILLRTYDYICKLALLKCAYLYTHVGVCIYIYIYKYIYTNVHTYIEVNTFKSMWIIINVFIYKNVNKCLIKWSTA